MNDFLPKGYEMPEMVAAHLEVARCGGERAMPEEDLNRAGIDPGVEEMRRKGIALSGGEQQSTPDLSSRPVA